VIDRALEHLAAHLNGHFRRNFHVAEDLVVVSNLQELGGAPVPLAASKLTLFLSGVERDTLAHRATTAPAAYAPSVIQHAAPVYLNLLVMCAANFSGSHYPEALKFLAGAIAFFQGNGVFDHHNTPGMDSRLERLILNMENLTSQEMHSLWSIHGGRYLPSALFRVRLITLDSNVVHSREPVVRQTTAEAAPQ
jgi:hypothetical protein